jgi:hypothetical protein
MGCISVNLEYKSENGFGFEGSGRCGDRETLGVLRYAQDDSKNKYRSKDENKYRSKDKNKYKAGPPLGEG